MFATRIAHSSGAAWPPSAIRRENSTHVRNYENDLELIGSVDFSQNFDEKGLALVYQEAISEGQVSRFNQIIYSPTS
jgi:hypothetical protein